MATPKMQPFWWFKKPPCPYGQQVVNGDFETGDNTGWTTGVVDTDHPHSGLYAFWVNLYQQLLILRWTDDINVKVSCIETFEFWHWNIYDKRVRVHYTDGSTSAILVIPVATDWARFDLLPYLDTDKRVANIAYWGGNKLDLLHLDDVSLWGKG
jgi:hypothetical protein